MGNKMKRFLSTALVLAMLSTNSLTALATESVNSTQKETQAASTVSSEEANTSAAAKNERTGETYESVTDALFTASEGDTVILLKDEEVSLLSVIDDVTLDLNGHTLKASYVTCFGNIVDQSEDNTGLLKVETKRFLIQDKNKQLPMKNGKGYQFFEVEKFNKAWQKELSRYSFQTCVEPSALEVIMQGTEVTGVTVNVRVSWTQGDGLRTQDFTYTDEMANKFFGSYDSETSKFGQMFTLVLNGTSAFEELTFSAVMVSDTGVEIASDSITVDTKEDTQNPDDTEKPDDTENPGSTGSSDVTTDENNKVTGDVQIEAGQASANVSAGTQLDENTNELKLTVKEMEVSDNTIEVEEKEEVRSVDVHVDGIAENNTVPIIVTVDEFAPEFLNQGNIRLYHVEDGTPVEMTRVYSLDELNEHNEYYYDPATGIVTMAMATFSEVAVVSDTEKQWEGKFDYSWYSNPSTDENGKTIYTIANADQLAAFGAIVGGMDGQTKDSFAGKTVKLIADINLADEEKNNVGNKIFYPIGYYNSTGSYTRTNGTVTSNVSAFCGTFDGNGHTISNFYQNTWEMFGDYNDGYSAGSNYYKDAMGLFGHVVNGKVCNLTVDNFSSDGEFTPTGVIAAYAENSTFENIAITKCNPRVYNTGNGGIVGIGGNTSDTKEKQMTFTNITIDNSNKISALWGSWDVACGGLMGMFRGYSEVKFTNCHVAAQIDVFNDVCGNYQYYWYRYAGMMIGSLRGRNTTDAERYTVPDMTDISAEGCTVHFGDWNDYYYCELVANSLASYTHDHQFSRLEKIKSLDEIKSDDTWLKTGNFLLIKGDTKTCYHIMKDAEGKLYEHKHDVVDATNPEINEVVNGETVLKENNQIVYLPFNQLFQGDGWGVKHVPIYDDGKTYYDGITILDREVADSVDKFDVKYEEDTISNNVAINASDLFTYIESCGVDVDNEAFYIGITDLDGDDEKVTAEFERGATWKESTITLTGTGRIKITAQDYQFCNPCSIEVDVIDRKQEEKFDLVFENTDKYLYRVGNAEESPVSLESLFKAKDGAEIGKVSVTVEAVKGSSASGTYAENATWTKGAIQFSGTGVVKVTIADDDTYCKPTELILEVVDAVNATKATDATGNNVVLLNDISSGFTVSGRYTVYGNGFTLKYTGNGQYLNNGLKQGVVTVYENGTLDNLRIEASIYPAAYMYYGQTLLGEYVQGGPSTKEGDKTRYHYQLSAVVAKDNATISNCYIYGGRNNIFVNTGDVVITDSVLECGVVSNVQIQSNSSHTITFNNVTTIQHQVTSNIGDTPKVMLGAGILVGPDTSDNPTVVLKGYFKQYNWVNEDDAANVTNETAKMIVNAALEATEYNHTVNGKIASNLGIIYMNTFEAKIIDEESEINGIYKLSNITIKPEGFGGNPSTGQVYSLKNATEDQICSDIETANRVTVNGLYEPQFKYSADLGGQMIDKTDNGDEHCYREGDTIYVMFPSGDTKELDLAKLVNIEKYTDQDLGLTVTCKDSNGNNIDVTDNKITLSAMDEYTVTYTVTDKLFFDKNGNTVLEKEPVNDFWDITINVSLKDTAVPDARFDFNTDSQKMGYYKPTIGDVKQYLPFLAGLKIYDYNGKTEYLRFDGDADFNKVASITITGYESNKALVEIKLTDGGVINTRFLARANSGGASTYTGSIKTKNNVIYFVNGGGTSNSASTTTSAYWYVDYYKFTGNNGVAIQSAQQTFNSTGSSASTPSGSFSTTIKYTVTYDANEGNCGQTTGYSTSASAAVTLPTPTRSGYIFSGWYTAASGGDKVGGAGDPYTPSANITLYAQWGKPSTVTYNANGGTCGTASEKYTGTALTLPTPTRDGYWFVGWYDAASGGNIVGDAGEAYNPKVDITLYAHWQEAIEYTVTYNANGGTCGTASATYQGTALTLPTPTRTGYKFLGWYTAASGGTKIEDAGANYTPSSNITLYAQWEQISYTITISKQNNATVTVDKTTAHYNDTISVTVSFSQNNSKTLTVKDALGNTVLSKSAAGTYTFTMPASNVTIEASSSGGCVTPDTLVTLADGTQKRIDEISYKDKFLVWDFVTGEYKITSAAIINNHGKASYVVTSLIFDDGTEINTIAGHGFYHKDSNQFIMLNDENVQDYVGEAFLKQDMNTEVELIDYSIKTEEVESWSILTAEHHNAMLNGMFTLTPGEVEGSEKYLMPFEVNGNLKYDEESRQADIEEYGLYEYEDFKENVTYEQFKALNLPIFKVSVGKGYITYEDILYLLELHCK